MIHAERVRIGRMGAEARIARHYSDPIEAFWRDVQTGEGCWEWQLGRNAKGYGDTRHVDGPSPRKRELAHRVAWFITHGAIPDGLFVLHRCDNPPCVRPDHLFLGTKADNARDASAKGRMHPGTATHGAKLTELDVRAIRSLAGRLSERLLAERFGLSQPAIHRILKGERWGWVR